MNRQSVSQLEKVLALADSTHDGEAIVAVRKARQMLSRDGLCFSDLARAASRRAISLPFGFFTDTPPQGAAGAVTHLQSRLDHLQGELEARDAQAQYWKKRAAELEQKLNQSKSEAERWHKLAHDTVNKLWDLGQSMQDEPLASAEASPKIA